MGKAYHPSGLTRKQRRAIERGVTKLEGGYSFQWVEEVGTEDALPRARHLTEIGIPSIARVLGMSRLTVLRRLNPFRRGTRWKVSTTGLSNALRRLLLRAIPRY